MELIEDELMKIVEALAQKQAFSTIKSIMTICLNLCNSPTEDRYRTLRISNPSVSRTLMTQPLAIEFLEKLGFVKVDGFLSLVGNDPTLYKIALTVLSSKHHKSPSTNKNTNNQAQTPELRPTRDVASISINRPPKTRVISPTSTWQDVIEHKYLGLSGLPPFGECILVYGVSGSGKTLVSHAAAEAWGLRVFTIYGSEVHTPFAKSRNGTLKHLLRHAQEVGPCLVLLREMDNILSKVVEEVRNEFSQFPSSKLVVMAICTSTDKLINASHCNLPRVSPNRLLKSMAKMNIKCQPPIITRSNNNQQQDVFKDQLSCFDILVHVPLLQNPSSIALLLQRNIEKNGGKLSSAVSRMVCDTVIHSSGDSKEGMTGNKVKEIALASLEIARQREGKLQSHNTKVSISSEVLREAFDEYVSVKRMCEQVNDA